MVWKYHMIRVGVKMLYDIQVRKFEGANSCFWAYVRTNNTGAFD